LVASLGFPLGVKGFEGWRVERVLLMVLLLDMAL